MKKLTVRWVAVYETEIEVPDNATETQIHDAAAKINIAVLGSKYQTDTWEVESIESKEA